MLQFLCNFDATSMPRTPCRSKVGHPYSLLGKWVPDEPKDWRERNRSRHACLSDTVSLTKTNLFQLQRNPSVVF